MYDSPFAACNVSGRVQGYTANGSVGARQKPGLPCRPLCVQRALDPVHSVSYLISSGASVTAMLPARLINLTRGTGLDTCGAWLNAVDYDADTGAWDRARFLARSLAGR
jgi:hypothetical protein